MSILKQDTKKRIIISLTDEKAGKDLIDAIEAQADLSNSIIDITSYIDEGATAVGFQERNDVIVTIDDTTRTLTVAPQDPEKGYNYFAENTLVNVKEEKSIVWPDTNGSHFFYLNKTGELKVIENFADTIILKHAIVSIIYWDQTSQKHIYFADERHGIAMANATHLYLHTTRGAAFDRGCNLIGFSVDGNGSSNAHAQFTAQSGSIWDEDLKINIPAQSMIPVLYRLNNGWKRKEADGFCVIQSGAEGYAGTTIAYNLFNGTSWSLSEVDNNKFVLAHIFATNDYEYPFIAILGTQQYNSKSAARTGAIQEIKKISQLPVQEFCPIGSVIFQTNSNYTNDVKALIVSTESGEDFEDHRSESIRPGSLG
jgi:hypothetical protein